MVRWSIAAWILSILALPLSAQTRVFEFSSIHGGFYGHSVAGVGDLNGDGTPDIAVSAPSTTILGVSIGRVEVRSGRDGTRIHTWEGSASLPQLGTAVAGVGDVDGDGVPDVGVGAAGRVQIRSGSNGAILHDLQESLLGSVIAAAGDVNGDGRDDFLLGMPELNTLQHWAAGRALLVSGADGSLLRSWTGSHHGERLGASLGSTPDSLLIGSPGGQGPGVSGSGVVLVVAKSTLSPRFLLAGVVQGSEFGNAVDDAGDFDGDGVHDLVVGARDESHVVAFSAVGTVRVFSGVDGSLLHESFGSEAGAAFGSDISSIGDYDGDGTPDLLVASRSSAIGGVGSGRVQVVSGGSGVSLFSLQGSSGSSFGCALDAVGDLDQDGLQDWVIGARGAFVASSASGRAFVYTRATQAVASSLDLGGGCGLGGVPQITLSTPPRLGHASQVLSSGWPGLSTATLLVQLAPPSQLSLGAGCTLALTPAAASKWIAFPLIHDLTGSGALSLPIPDMPLLAGSVITFQGWMPEPAGPLGIRLSNGLRLELGY